MKKIIICLLAALVLFVPLGVIAADKSVEVKENEEYTGRVLLENEKYPISHYKLETDVGDGFLDSPDRALASINNGLWSLNTAIANFSIFAVDQLLSFNLISQVVDQAAIISENIFNSMAKTFLSMFIVIAGGIAAYRLLVARRASEAIKALVSSMIILVACLWFFSDTKGNIIWLNDLSSDLEGIAASTNVVLTSENKDTDKPYNQQEGYAVLKNQMFNLMIKQPYLYLNYGSTKESEVIADDSSRVTKLLKLKPYHSEGKEKREDIVSKEVKDNDNVNMTTDYSGERFGKTIIMLLTTLSIAVPFVFIAGLKFLLQIFFLAALIFTAIPLIFSLLPSHSGTAANHFKHVVSIAFYKAVLVLLLSVITGILTLLYESLKLTDGLEGHMLLSFVTALVTFGLVKYRNQILEVATAGYVKGDSGADRMQANMSQAVTNTLHKGSNMVKRFSESKGNTANMKQEPVSSRNTAAGSNLQVLNGGKSEKRGEDSNQRMMTSQNGESHSPNKSRKSGVNTNEQQKQSLQRKNGAPNGSSKEEINQAKKHRAAERHGENQPNHFRTNPYHESSARNEKIGPQTASELTKNFSDLRNNQVANLSKQLQGQRQQEQQLKEHKGTTNSQSPKRKASLSEPKSSTPSPSSEKRVMASGNGRLNKVERKPINRMKGNE